MTIRMLRLSWLIEALKMGAADFIQKPFEMDVIVNTVEKVMEE